MSMQSTQLCLLRVLSFAGNEKDSMTSSDWPFNKTKQHPAPWQLYSDVRDCGFGEIKHDAFTHQPKDPAALRILASDLCKFSSSTFISCAAVIFPDRSVCRSSRFELSDGNGFGKGIHLSGCTSCNVQYLHRQEQQRF